MKTLALALGAAALAAAPVTALIACGESVPVQLEAGDGLDPCALGVITDVGQGSSALVRTGPAATYETVDDLFAGDTVWVCQSRNDHYGIVYRGDPGFSGPEEDCAVSSPVESTSDYTGPCASGWISAKRVEIVAG